MSSYFALLHMSDRACYSASESCLRVRLVCSAMLHVLPRYNCRFTEAAVCADGLDAPCLDNEHGLLSFGGFSDKAPVNEIMVIWEV